ncbi:hypothetical protein KFU94_01005 [Chloroflexi bacterium TSY]|nr:hypothetical protein [Chloroflexi bacterium TSY]
MPPERHPFAISAVDLSLFPQLEIDIDQFATAISQTLFSPTQVFTATLLQTYNKTQKLDYDSDFVIESDTDGFVDLYDFALQSIQNINDDDIRTAASKLVTTLDTAIVAERHRSGSPWSLPITQVWNLTNVHGLSIFLPIGEELELPIIITTTSQITSETVLTRNLQLREMYTKNQLKFVERTKWGDLIDRYYELATPSIGVTDGPIDGLLQPDISPPETFITYTGVPNIGDNIQISWQLTDTQSAIISATLWQKLPTENWTVKQSVQYVEENSDIGQSSRFIKDNSENILLSEICTHKFSLQAMDSAGNLEPIGVPANSITVRVEPCNELFLPFLSTSHIN